GPPIAPQRRGEEADGRTPRALESRLRPVFADGFRLKAGLQQGSGFARAHSLAAAVAGTGERYESNTRTFSQFSLFSSTNFRCRGWSWYLSCAALLAKTRCRETSKFRSLTSRFRSPARLPVAKETVPSCPVSSSLHAATSLARAAPEAS